MTISFLQNDCKLDKLSSRKALIYLKKKKIEVQLIYKSVSFKYTAKWFSYTYFFLDSFPS